ncbi:unnamed protein product [Sphenostylis stenocarpa]|uniref:Uncharacterized protein n=1 Tax=Sphenostylis stenocarpa TaxID=92480 RepID=A0AA86T641_9FABA|nr:unnamed protein product [Sphenostylis stenocarpa]
MELKEVFPLPKLAAQKCGLVPETMLLTLTDIQEKRFLKIRSPHATRASSLCSVLSINHPLLQ